MAAVLIRFSKRFRRLVLSSREAWLRPLDAGKSDRDLRELGWLSVDFRPVRPGGRAEFELMTRRLGVDLDRLPLCSRGALRDAERVCLHCLDVRRCRRWLAGEVADDPQLFCPNAPLFRTIASRKASSSGEPLQATCCDLAKTDRRLDAPRRQAPHGLQK